MTAEPIRSLWNDEEAAGCRGDLPLRVYTSRLLGRDKPLVLHGGDNTSVKLKARNILGEEEDLICIKGSGWDLETIEEAGSPRCRWAPVRPPGAPALSVETILHALLPYKFVDHTHDVAELAAEMGGPLFAKTTAACTVQGVSVPITTRAEGDTVLLRYANEAGGVVVRVDWIPGGQDH